MPLLARPPAVTTTLLLPTLTPAGTGTTMLVLLQLKGVAAVLLNVTVLVPWDKPKLLPVIVTCVATPPESGDRPVICGATAKFTGLLDRPFTVTTTALLPEPAAAGTGTTMLVLLQLVGVATVPLNVTVLLP